VNTVMNLELAYNAGNFLTSWVLVEVRTNTVHGVLAVSTTLSLVVSACLQSCYTPLLTSRKSTLITKIFCSVFSCFLKLYPPSRRY
jgi:hypothetical protein